MDRFENSHDFAEDPDRRPGDVDPWPDRREGGASTHPSAAGPTWSSAMERLLPGGEGVGTEEPEPLTVAGAQVFSDAVTRQAAELRAAALRMASERLDAAEQEAAEIVRAANDEAARTKSETARAMARRLDEANEAAEALRQAAVEHARSLREEADQILAATLAKIPALRVEFEEMVGRVDEVAQSLDSVNQGLQALRARAAPEGPSPQEPPR